MRNRIAGIYIQDNKILLVKHRKNNKEYYLLPGGGQDENEAMKDALSREWKEELNLSVKIEELLFIGESISPKLLEENHKHVIQFVFEISNISGDIKIGADGILFDYEFVEIDKLSELVLYPNCYKQIYNFIKNKKNLNYEKYVWKK